MALAPDPTNGDVLIAATYDGQILYLHSDERIHSYPQSLTALGVFTS